ncbi:hypothetical protein DFH11DRAFT_623969 [Phellopilus nigrolimitatus]|nr:hypothetical protein DFH11DRAFT_623969 [Phellopilus nigrolimitatus]
MRFRSLSWTCSASLCTISSAATRPHYHSSEPFFVTRKRSHCQNTRCVADHTILISISERRMLPAIHHSTRRQRRRLVDKHSHSGRVGNDRASSCHSECTDVVFSSRFCAPCTILSSSCGPLRTATQAAETTAARVRPAEAIAATPAAAAITANPIAAAVHARSTAQSKGAALHARALARPSKTPAARARTQFVSAPLLPPSRTAPAPQAAVLPGGDFPAQNAHGQRICRQCGVPGRYEEGKCVEKWGTDCVRPVPRDDEAR